MGDAGEDLSSVDEDGNSDGDDDGEHDGEHEEDGDNIEADDDDNEFQVVQNAILSYS